MLFNKRIMIYIQYKIKKSDIHGIGLFAEQDIIQGEYVYARSPLLDVDITIDEFQSLNHKEQKEVTYYGYFHKKTQKWHVAFYAIRILKHAEHDVANVTQDSDMVMTAKRDIQKGEELFQDYIEIFPDGSEHFTRINN